MRTEIPYADLERHDKTVYPGLHQLTSFEISYIWDAVFQHVRQQLELNKGVRISGLGTFFPFKGKLYTGGNQFSIVHRPVFNLCKTVARVHGLKYAKVKVPGITQISPLNYAQIAAGTNIPRKLVQMCIQETLRVFSSILEGGDDAVFVFKSIGVLDVQGKEVTAKFYRTFIESLDKSGKLVDALLTCPWIKQLIVSSKEEALALVCSRRVFLFPQMQAMTGHPKNAEEGSLGELVKPKEEKKPRVQTERNQKGHLLDKFCVLRESLPPRRLARAEAKEDGEEKAKGEEPPVGVFPPCPGPPKKTEEHKKRGRKTHPDITATAAPQCEDHRRAGQEMCYICMQRDERVRQESLAEERRRKDLAEWRELAEHKARRERNEMWRAQVRILEERHPEYVEMKRKAIEERREHLKSLITKSKIPNHLDHLTTPA